MGLMKTLQFYNHSAEEISCWNALKEEEKKNQKKKKKVVLFVRFGQGPPCDTKSPIRAVVLLSFKKTPPSMLLDEPTILNKEADRKSKLHTLGCGTKGANLRFSW